MPDQNVRVRVDLLAAGGAGAVFQSLRQQTYAMAQNTARVQANLAALGSRTHLSALREQYRLQQALGHAAVRNRQVENVARYGELAGGLRNVEEAFQGIGQAAAQAFSQATRRI